MVGWGFRTTPRFQTQRRIFFRHCAPENAEKCPLSLTFNHISLFLMVRCFPHWKIFNFFEKNGIFFIHFPGESGIFNSFGFQPFDCPPNRRISRSPSVSRKEVGPPQGFPYVPGPPTSHVGLSGGSDWTRLQFPARILSHSETPFRIEDGSPIPLCKGERPLFHGCIKILTFLVCLIVFGFQVIFKLGERVDLNGFGRHWDNI